MADKETLSGWQGQALPLEENPGGAPTEPKGTETKVEEPKTEEGDKETKSREDEVTTPPAERTYSKGEWDKRQSAIDKQVGELKRQASEELERARKEREDLVDDAQRSRDDGFLRKTEEDGGDVNAAKAMVARDTSIRERERTAERAGRDADTRLAAALDSEKVVAAHQIAKEHQLPESFIDKLMGAEDRRHMENIALTEVIARGQQATKLPVKTDKGISTAPKGVDMEGWSPEAKMIWAYEHEGK